MQHLELPSTVAWAIARGETRGSRQGDFLLGRDAARSALAKLGANAAQDIARAQRGNPAWPHGIVGSITHTRGIAIAVVGRSAIVKYVGVDLESRKRRLAVDPAALMERIGDAQEQSWMRAKPNEAHFRTLLLFSAKEAVYKAFAPRSGAFFGFDAVSLSWQEKDRSFAAQLNRELAPELPAGFKFSVLTQCDEDFVFTAVICG